MSLISNMTQYQFQRTDIKQEEMQQFVNTVTMMHCEAEQRKTNNSRKSLTLTNWLHICAGSSLGNVHVVFQAANYASRLSQ